MKYGYMTENTCSKAIIFDLDGDVVTNVQYFGGCDGNLKAIGKLVEGQDAKRVAEILRGNDCNGRGTSCADQFAQAIEAALEEEDEL